MTGKNPRHDHGNTPAAWTFVVITLIGCTAAGLGLIWNSTGVVLTGAGIVVAGALVGKLMQMMGLGKQLV
jgi:hypothetical protein